MNCIFQEKQNRGILFSCGLGGEEEESEGKGREGKGQEAKGKVAGKSERKGNERKERECFLDSHCGSVSCLEAGIERQGFTKTESYSALPGPAQLSCRG